MRFTDRADAGRRLARRLARFADSRAVVYALPRGGVPVGAEVAHDLRLPLDVVLVRKLGVPSHAEWGMGAIGEDGTKVLNESVVQAAGVQIDQITEAVRREERILAARREAVRSAVPPIDARGRTAIVVDDGLATGGTARAACMVLRARGADKVVLAVPVAPPGWEDAMDHGADEFIALETPAYFTGVGQFYEDFAPVTDETMIGLLVGVRAESAPAPRTQDVAIPVSDGVLLDGFLCVPDGAVVTVAFVHGSGSSRHSPRNQAVAGRLAHAGIATLLFDLLTPDEEATRTAVFDVGLLVRRLTSAVEWLRHNESTCATAIGLFGASTGAAAALRVAASDPAVAGVMCRGGRTDLADDVAGDVRCPVLMVVGSRDTEILRANRRSCAAIGTDCTIEEVPGASHLFEEAGTLDHVANSAVAFFARVGATTGG